MDLKSLLQKLETIDKKQNLMEAEKKETTWTDKSGKKHPATQVKGDKYTGKEAEKEFKSKKTDEDFNFKPGGIAHQLLSEFNLVENVPNPWEGSDPEKAAAWAALSPEDQKWLGGADPTDTTILARAPNKGKPAAAAPAAAAPGSAPAAAAPGSAPAAAPAAAPTIDPKKLARFKELLAKASKQ